MSGNLVPGRNAHDLVLPGVNERGIVQVVPDGSAASGAIETFNHGSRSLLKATEIAAISAVAPSTVRTWTLQRHVGFFRIEGIVRYQIESLLAPSPAWPTDFLEFIRKPDLAAFLHVTERTVENWMKQNLLPVRRLGGSVRFCWKEVLFLLENRYWFPASASGCSASAIPGIGMNSGRFGKTAK